MPKLIHRLPLMVLCFALINFSTQGAIIGSWNLNRTVGWGHDSGILFSILEWVFTWEIIMPITYWILIKKKFKPPVPTSLLHLLVLLSLTVFLFIGGLGNVDTSFIAFIFLLLNWLVFIINIIVTLIKGRNIDSPTHDNILDADL